MPNNIKKESFSRTCKHSLCKKKIKLDSEKFIYVEHETMSKLGEKGLNKYFYHYECYLFIQQLKEKGKTKEVIEIESLPLLKKSEEFLKFEKDKYELENWLKKAYQTSISTYFTIKLNQIYNGTYKSIGFSIAPCDILEIWQRKYIEMNNINASKRSKGVIIENDSRINYDLSIVLSKYNSFKKWKDSQIENKAQEEEVKKSLVDNSKIRNSNMSKAVMSAIHKKNAEITDLSDIDILEEI